MESTSTFHNRYLTTDFQPGPVHCDAEIQSWSHLRAGKFTHCAIPLMAENLTDTESRFVT